ncbi:hypothetical protein [Kangiella sediminilitoris]|uniref:Uncharacterized protein n=1 Tax=Kangiella sediminilitoris TaxID=1144748 RepID=A0A1B3BDN3_9GAMM|nr:hypothetical protein [Kangiella sediminilitoris]AOE50922.1 hypothetical protein KS2013_2217 [Kangiella sediminilitoris]
MMLGTETKKEKSRKLDRKDLIERRFFRNENKKMEDSTQVMENALKSW